jgi:hypothetical protein
MNPDKLITMAEFVVDLTQYRNIDINAIHELTEIMNNTKIHTETELHTAVRAGQYIIGSFHPSTGLSFNGAPTVQYSPSQARTECKRLAKLYPGKTFVYVKLLGAEMIVAQPTSVSI